MGKALSNKESLTKGDDVSLSGFMRFNARRMVSFSS